MRARIKEAVEAGRLEEVDKLVASDAQFVRHVLGLTYHAEASVRQTAARSIALASRHHPRLIQDIVRRLVWAMNDESGTHANTAPAVIEAIADEQPELLLPVVPDLIRLAGDPALEPGLATALRTIVQSCPGRVGQELQNALNARITRKGCRHA